MFIDDFMALLADVPPRMALYWAIWMAAGLALSRWHLQSRSAFVYQRDEPWPLPKPKSAVRATAPAREEKLPEPPPPDSSDPFGDLERIFEGNVGSHRTPGESPILNSAGSPVLAATDHDAVPSQGRA